ncbi:DUF6065 family protein [Sinorhizobium medicae]|uniref:DUF6065 family protein n=1 Tax=Sinorhizobium medicae TaxID=110321 RepID=UPI001AAEF7F8|nr:DUF6065 family protein [Sinorhizobium medicae]MDW9359449.1 hypothetical protein [Sinorhizobium meliloti]MBO1965314.1 hypothetical protein [Sinorhizobium medicae]MDW9943436.1 hypothetical protein [Sinorhizobium meliloti]WQO56784.1 DUF6065 family protein [Sinorhizobium medicae]WQP41131.1 DUF6065 family protein [Sinorhizobium medicae]
MTTLARGQIEFVRYQAAVVNPRAMGLDPAQISDPAAVHCGPFVAASTLGYFLFPPFEAEVVHTSESEFRVTTDDPLRERLWSEVARELHGSATPWWCSKIRGVFQIDTGFLISTAPGTKVLVLNPLNRANDLFHTQAGLVETDVFRVPFTINLQLKQGECSFLLRKTEPIAQIIPIDETALQREGPTISDIRSHPELRAEWICYRDFAFDMHREAGRETRRTRSAYQKWIRARRK